MMKTRPDHGFTLSGDAHISSWFRRNIPLLTSIVNGRDAQRALNDLESIRADARTGLIILPAFLWVPGDPTAVGRKAGYRLEGPKNLLPMRLTWQPGTVTLITEDQGITGHTIINTENDITDTPLEWTSVGPGYSGRGSLNARFDGCNWHRHPSGVTAHTEVSAIGNTLPTTALDRDILTTTLTDLIDRGHLAYWDLLTELEDLLRSALERARVAVSSELSDSLELDYQQAVSDTTLESILADLTYGADGTGRSRVMRLIDRCCEAGSFRKVDPQRYIIVALREQASSGIRKKLGDPHIGPKVRRVIGENPGLNTVAGALNAYRAAYPNDRLGVERLCAAFTFAPDPTAATTPLHLSNGDELSFASKAAQQA